MKFTRVMSLAVGAALLGAVGAHALNIDDFNALSTAPIPPAGKIEEPFPAVILGPVLAQATASTLNIIGGTRELQLINHGVSGGFATGTSVKDVGVTATGAGTMTTTTGLDASLTLWWDGTAEGVSPGNGFDATGVRTASGLGGLNLIALSGGPSGAFVFEVLLSDVSLDVTIIACQEGTSGATLGDCVADQFTKPPQFLSTFLHPFSAFSSTAKPILLSELGSATMQEAFIGRATVGSAAADAVLSNLGAIGLIVRADLRSIGSVDLTLDRFGTTNVPEPTAVLLMGSGLAGLGLLGYVRRRRQQL